MKFACRFLLASALVLPPAAHAAPTTASAAGDFRNSVGTRHPHWRSPSCRATRGMEPGRNRGVSRKNPFAFQPDWVEHWANEVEFAFAK